jgi:tetratricopeptide (TPR) repeat protein
LKWLSGTLAAALASTTLAIASEPRPESVRLVHRGMDLADNDNYSGAIRAYTQAIEIDPRNGQAYQERAMALLELQRDREAIADFERALAINPKFPGARPWLAKTLADLGEHRRAAEEFLRDLRDHPDGDSYMGISPWTWTECAEEFALSGDRDKAIALLEEYFDRHAARVTRYIDDETAPMRLLARLYDESGKPREAEQFRKRARASKHRKPADL